MKQNFYQISLILFAVLLILGIASFAYRELFPEYKSYQYAYKALEKFRAEYTEQSPPPFSMGIKQILVPKGKEGPEKIDRCTSCHVAIDLPHFSPTRLIHDPEGNPVVERNPDYIWGKLPPLKRLKIEGGDEGMEKVLQMHPLIGKETRPFQFHPLEQYGCTTCHNGNGQSLIAQRAHGPTFDGDYEPAHQGKKPQFTESDPDNDPKFSRMYNNKPGHNLTFQTTPLFSGPLLGAKCVECHRVEDTQEPKTAQNEGKVDRLIQHYQRGKELFISQGCYACHRIAGFSRASIGPELTHAGHNYPWYIKESIVWPQADLSSSTMPNSRLDHEELADLMTFLMAQKGGPKAIGEIDYQMALIEWEQGEKMPWEKPIPPTHLESIRQGQIVFASEGCASCHKLEGFDSNVVLKGSKEWFQTSFPQQIAGSTLSQIVEEKKEEIDRYIVVQETSNKILEEIETRYPGLIESFYTNFKFAHRAFNTAYENHPDKLKEYQERLTRVLLVYVQEYGLGREIAPHLNWSGVYRDNEWLMGHFHNPSAFTTRSIMPAMPFDETKFHMLNTLLHALGRSNRDRLQETWRSKGFNPSLAYEKLCSSCHGVQRQGNGVIAEWIYPIPKNLRNPVFLRNLTKERAIDSITHGVKGTPMPPWGEAISSGELGDQIPVLNQNEIAQLVDWLFQNVPYYSPLKKGEDDGKWRYTPSDMIVEMQKEKNFLNPVDETKHSTEEWVELYFEKRPNTLAGSEPNLYFIREKYYTSENLVAAKEYFTTNCASCHGTDGGGTGLRAISMVEAKPRMFTHVPWIEGKDDLRLLRSIKYGVPGTSMVPWGDQTTIAQRMQLVMYIRDLTRVTRLRADLETLLYHAYNPSLLAVEEARMGYYQQLESIHLELKNVHKQLDVEQSTEKLGTLYARSLELKKQTHHIEEQDQHYLTLISLLKGEKQIYANLGAQVVAANVGREAIDRYFEIVNSQHFEFTQQEGRLHLGENSDKNAASTALLHDLDEKIAQFQTLIDLEKEKISSAEGEQRLKTLLADQLPLINLRTQFLSLLTQADSLRTQQKTLFSHLF
jgi:mono/diheme cytochrome c family protein